MPGGFPSSPAMAPFDGPDRKPLITGLEAIPQDVGLEVRRAHSDLEVNQASSPYPITGQWAYYGSPVDKEVAQQQKKIAGLPAQIFLTGHSSCGSYYCCRSRGRCRRVDSCT